MVNMRLILAARGLLQLYLLGNFGALSMIGVPGMTCHLGVLGASLVAPAWVQRKGPHPGARSAGQARFPRFFDGS